jgi:hypothetical protein
MLRWLLAPAALLLLILLAVASTAMFLFAARGQDEEGVVEMW